MHPLAFVSLLKVGLRLLQVRDLGLWKSNSSWLVWLAAWWCAGRTWETYSDLFPQLWGTEVVISKYTAGRLLGWLSLARPADSGLGPQMERWRLMCSLSALFWPSLGTAWFLALRTQVPVQIHCFLCSDTAQSDLPVFFLVSQDCVLGKWILRRVQT